MEKGKKKGRYELSTFARNLKALMNEHKLGVRDIATVADTAKSNVQNWLVGHVPSDFEAILKIANRFGVSVSWLLTGKSEQHSSPPSVSAVFEDGGLLYKGYVHVTVRKVIPNNMSDKESDTAEVSVKI